MEHKIYRVESFEVVAPYTLLITFDDDTQQTIDFQPVLAGEMYGPLRDLALFNQVILDREVHTLYGQTEPILIRLLCMSGPNTPRRW